MLDEGLGNSRGPKSEVIICYGWNRDVTDSIRGSRVRIRIIREPRRPAWQAVARLFRQSIRRAQRARRQDLICVHPWFVLRRFPIRQPISRQGAKTPRETKPETFSATDGTGIVRIRSEDPWSESVKSAKSVARLLWLLPIRLPISRQGAKTPRETKPETFSATDGAGIVRIRSGEPWFGSVQSAKSVARLLWLLPIRQPISRQVAKGF